MVVPINFKGLIASKFSKQKQNRKQIETCKKEFFFKMLKF